MLKVLGKEARTTRSLLTTTSKYGERRMSIVILKGKNNTYGTYQNGKLVATHQGLDTYKQDVIPQAEKRNDGDIEERPCDVKRVEEFKAELAPTKKVVEPTKKVAPIKKEAK